MASDPSTVPPSPAAALPRLSPSCSPEDVRRALEGTPAVTLSYARSTRSDFYAELRVSSVLVLLGYAFVCLMIMSLLVSAWGTKIDRPAALLTLVLVSLAGTGHHVYRKLFETPYTAEERWAWLDFQARELRRSTERTGRVPTAWTERQRFEWLVLALDSPFLEHSDDPSEYEVYLSRRRAGDEAHRPAAHTPVLDHQERLYVTASREDALAVIGLFQDLTGCPAWDVTQRPGEMIRADGPPLPDHPRAPKIQRRPAPEPGSSRTPRPVPHAPEQRIPEPAPSTPGPPTQPPALPAPRSESPVPQPDRFFLVPHTPDEQAKAAEALTGDWSPAARDLLTRYPRRTHVLGAPFMTPEALDAELRRLWGRTFPAVVAFQGELAGVTYKASPRSDHPDWAIWGITGVDGPDFFDPGDTPSFPCCQYTSSRIDYYHIDLDGRLDCGVPVAIDARVELERIAFHLTHTTPRAYGVILHRLDLSLEQAFMLLEDLRVRWGWEVFHPGEDHWVKIYSGPEGVMEVQHAYETDRRLFLTLFTDCRAQAADLHAQVAAVTPLAPFSLNVRNATDPVLYFVAY